MSFDIDSYDAQGIICDLVVCFLNCCRMIQSVRTIMSTSWWLWQDAMSIIGKVMASEDQCHSLHLITLEPFLLMVSSCRWRVQILAYSSLSWYMAVWSTLSVDRKVYLTLHHRDQLASWSPILFANANLHSSNTRGWKEYVLILVALWWLLYHVARWATKDSEIEKRYFELTVMIICYLIQILCL